MATSAPVSRLRAWSAMTFTNGVRRHASQARLKDGSIGDRRQRFFARWMPAAVLSVLVLYVACRAALLSITHDEARTYVFDIKDSFLAIISFATPGETEINHMLFTVLAKVSNIVLGNSEFALRLPSVVAYAGFAVSCFLTLNLFVRGLILWLYFLFVAINPYVIDMFSVARGYGLAMALSAAGLYLILLAAIEEQDGRGHPWKPLAAGTLFALAALAHFVTLLLFISFLGLRVLMALRAAANCGLRRAVIIETAGLSLIAALLAVIAFGPLARIKASGDLRLGGVQDSFFWDTLGTLVAGSFRSGISSIDGIGGSIICVSVAAAIVLLALRRRALFTDRNLLALFVVTFLLVSASIGSVLQHDLLGTSFLTERRGVFLIPLFGGMCALLFASGNEALSKAGSLAAIAAALPLLALPRLALAADLHSTWDWAYDADTKAMIRLLERLPLARDGRQYSLGIIWLCEPSINFYIERDRLGWLRKVTRDDPAGDYVFYYVFRDDLGKVEQKAGSLAVIRQFPTARTVLAKRNSLPTD